MSRSGDLFLRIQYPEVVGAVGECELDGLLTGLQTHQYLWNYECTLGAAITAEDSNSTDGPPTQSQPDGPPTQSQPGVIRMAVDGEVTQGYYCKTAPAYNSSAVQGSSGSSTFTQTILVEMYMNVTLDDEKLKQVTGAVIEVIQSRLVAQRGISQIPKIRILRFSSS